MNPTLDVWMMWDERRNEQRFQIHFPVRVSEGENLTVSGGYEHLFRDDQY
ncbi:MAG: hypothetical protein NTX88_03635 [Candidatus Atribacteria bacterium]|nr:hypothetical protein [Candidatus Atribacteria bacterium]